MARKHKAFQGDLFGSSKADELRRQVRELDSSIAKALKVNDYPKAKELTKQQKKCIQELVDLGEEQSEH